MSDILRTLTARVMQQLEYLDEHWELRQDDTYGYGQPAPQDCVDLSDEELLSQTPEAFQKLRHVLDHSQHRTHRFGIWLWQVYGRLRWIEGLLEQTDRDIADIYPAFFAWLSGWLDRLEAKEAEYEATDFDNEIHVQLWTIRREAADELMHFLASDYIDDDPDDSDDD